MLRSDVCDDRQLIHTFCRYLLSTYYGLGTWLEAWGSSEQDPGPNSEKAMQ